MSRAAIYTYRIVRNYTILNIAFTGRAKTYASAVAVNRAACDIDLTDNTARFDAAAGIAVNKTIIYHNPVALGNSDAFPAAAGNYAI